MAYGQANCINCGRFIWPNGPGVSWSQTYTHLTLNDPVYRCSPCTDKHGIPTTNCNPNSGPWNGRNLIEGKPFRNAFDEPTSIEPFGDAQFSGGTCSGGEGNG